MDTTTTWPVDDELELLDPVDALDAPEPVAAPEKPDAPDPVLAEVPVPEVVPVPADEDELPDDADTCWPTTRSPDAWSCCGT